MATENRTPDDLQEAVAATLRRLRGEVGKPGATPAPAAPRVEPQLSAAAPAEPAPIVVPAANQGIIEPDLLSRSGPEIPPAPAASTFAGGAEQDRLETPPSRTRMLPYALSFIAIAVFAGIVWWAYQAIVAGPNKGPVPTITADANPAKVPPSDQQSTDTTGQQQTVYDQISGTNTSQPKTEVLLPTPEVPQTPPPPPTPVPSTTDAGTTTTDTGTTAPAPAASTDSGSATQTLVPPPAPLPPATTDGTAATTTSTDTSTAGTATTTAATTGTTSTDTSSGTATTTSGSAATTSATTADTGSTASSDTGTGNAVATNPSTDAGDLYGVPMLAPTTPSATTTSTPTTSTTTSSTTTASTTTPSTDTTVASADTSTGTQPAATADFRIQLAALKSEAEANSAWKRILGKHIDVLGSLTVHIVRADLGTQGIYYRVQAGPFPDKASAAAACEQLKSSGQQCLVKP